MLSGLVLVAAIRVACVGDSITQGIGTPQAADKSFPESYPAQLGKLLGSDYIVDNWGVGGRTLIRKADKIDYGRALRSQPDVVVVSAGTNDSKPYCWDNYASDYEPDYEKLVCEFKALPTHPRVIVCLPPPVFNGGQWGIRESVLENEIRPAVRRVAESTGAELLDLATPFREHPELFPDRVHPNPAGAGMIARLVADRITGRSSAPKAYEETVPVKGLESFKVSCANPGDWKFDISVNDESAEASIVTVHMTSGKPDVAPRFKIVAAVPQGAIAHLWSVNDNHFGISPFITRTISSAIGEGMPLYTYFDDAGASRLTLALDECRRRVTFAGGVREVGCAVESVFEFFTEAEAPQSEYAVRMRIDRAVRPFGEAVSDAGKWIGRTASCAKCTVPSAAFEPVYSTWYAFHQQMTAAEIEAECAKAAALGMKTVIIDDGWQTDRAEGGYRTCGDWEPAANKFPDMAGFVKRIHEKGMKVMLWYAVPFVGYESKNFGRAKNTVLFDYRRAKAIVVDPRFPGVRKNIVRTYVKAMKDWNLDGFKLDFIDRFKFEGLDPAIADNYNGRDTKSVPEAVNRLLKEIHDALVAIKPDVMIEFRQGYIGPAVAAYGNMLRAGDCPGDARQNRTATANLRLVADGRAVHSDMLEWSASATPEEAARAVFATLFATPQYSVRLNDIPEGQLRMMRHWIAFATTHRETLQGGAFRPSNPEFGYPVLAAESSGERIIVVYETDRVVKLGELDRNIIIVNATPNDSLLIDLPRAAQVQMFNTFGESVRVEPVAAGLNRMAIPQAGYGLVR